MSNGFYQNPTALKETAQDFTDSWVDIGSEIQTEGYRNLLLWLNVDINDTNNPRIRILAKRAYGGTDEYVLPIKTIGTSDVKVEDEYIELNDDADQKIVLSWNLDNLMPVVQVQIQAGTVGASAGQIESIYYSLGN